MNYMTPIFYLVVIMIIEAQSFIRKNYQHATMALATSFLVLCAMLFEVFGFRAFLCESAIAMAMLLYLIFFQESEYRLNSRILKAAARRDALTGAYNRAGYEAIIGRMKQEKDLLLGFMILDIDKFKEVNDEYGHEAGDYVLINVSKMLKATFRSSDYIIRYGGDEFVVILTGITENLGFVIKKKIDSLNGLLENPISNLPACSVSDGLAFSDQGFSDELFRKADRALYYSKATTKRSCTIYNEQFGKTPVEETKLPGETERKTASWNKEEIEAQIEA